MPDKDFTNKLVSEPTPDEEWAAINFLQLLYELDLDVHGPDGSFWTYGDVGFLVADLNTKGVWK